MQAVLVRQANERVNKTASISFFAIHFTPLLAIYTGVSLRAVVLCLALFWVRLLAITAGYHRYFSHRSYTLGRVPQFILALIGTSAAQKGPLWWAAHHRDHHRYSDTPEDIHSPALRGFWWSHVLWILCDKYKETKFDRIRDFAKYPELVWLNKRDMVAPWVLAIGCWLFAGWSGLVIGFFLSTILLWHATFTINSLAHVYGKRRYNTSDTSRNSWPLALLTLGEGWHNNHHRYQASARNGFYWWEIDITYYVILAFKRLGVVKKLRPVPLAVLAEGRQSAS